MLGLVFGLLLACPGQAPETKPVDALVAEVNALLDEARREIGRFEAGGGKRSAAEHPVSTWVAKLSAFRDRHPGTPAAGRAATEAIHLLVHAERIAEAEARADALPPDDPAWRTLGPILLEGAAHSKDYGFAVRKLAPLADRATDPALAASLRFQLAQGYWKRGDHEAAKAAFAAVARSGAEASLVKQAETALNELNNLGYGMAAPDFSATARDGSSVSLPALRGKVVLLVFWAST